MAKVITNSNGQVLTANGGAFQLEHTITVTDITALTGTQLDSLVVGDFVVKQTNNQKRIYIVAYKDSVAGELSLVYTDRENVEEVYYEKTNAVWGYVSTNSVSLNPIPTISTNLETDKNSDVKTSSPKSIHDVTGSLSDLTTVLKTNLVAAINEIAGQSSSHKIVAGVIRHTDDGWVYIDDAGHTPINVSGNPVISANGQNLTINFNFTASKVRSFVCNCDETWSQYFSVGASVGLSSATLNIHNFPIVQGGMTIYDPNDTLQVAHDANGWTTAFLGGVDFIDIYNHGATFQYNFIDLPYTPKTENLFMFSAGCTTFVAFPQRAGTNVIGCNFKKYDGTDVLPADYPTDASMRVTMTRILPTEKLSFNDIEVNNHANIWFFGIFD